MCVFGCILLLRPLLLSRPDIANKHLSLWCHDSINGTSMHVHLHKCIPANNHLQRDVILLILSTVLGVAIMMSSVTTKGAHYGTFALWYFATMHTLAPLPFVGSVVVGLLLAIGYIPVLYISTGSQSTIDIDIIYAELTLLASLLLYVVLRYRYLHYLAIDVIEHAVLIRDRENIVKEQQRGKDILLSMVPESLIEHIEDDIEDPYGEKV